MIKKYSRIVGLLWALSIPLVMVAKNEHNPIVQNNPFLKKINDTWDPRSLPREMIEQLFVAFFYASAVIKDEKVTMDFKKGMTDTRDLLHKRATYSFLNKAVVDGWATLKEIKKEEKKDFTENYDKHIKPWVTDGFDFVFRGINYLNDEQKEHSLTAYVKNDFLPYVCKAKTVFFSQILFRKLLERFHYGQLLTATYDVGCLLPLIGIELEELPTVALKYCYDKSVTHLQHIIKKMYSNRVQHKHEKLVDPNQKQ